MTEVLQKLWDVRVFLAAVVLFAVGFVTLLLHRNLMKKIIGLNIMDTAAYLLLTALGFIEGRLSPIVLGENTDPLLYVNPLPAGLVLTGIVVSVSVTAVLLALTVRLYKRYHTLDLDVIYATAMKEHGVN
ncbi:MAG: cation:proton antiporter subunit C [Clostridia bacterium]|nr:cation:proton antiporter subunit C [Clostridia bacterium]MBQ2111466.1 cation:proton antiporter subunit C [Clostridia bacterium]MBQ2192060.1 cation:proton antiporter subunit C [Clostridia bacterium]MBQ3938340.1 cation:proton antiporter subunit C [Clostridia bacterium]MBQ5487457.1 cation:proton antiporter subunit C [Clostridia bacterium]